MHFLHNISVHSHTYGYGAKMFVESMDIVLKPCVAEGFDSQNREGWTNFWSQLLKFFSFDLF